MGKGGIGHLYTDEEKQEALRIYVDNNHGVLKASQACNIPYQTICTWVKTNWAQDYIKRYELKSKGEIIATATQQLLDAKVEHLTSEYYFDEKANIILSLIEDRTIELIPKTTSIKELTGMYKVVSDIKLKMAGLSDEPDRLSDNQMMIVNLIEKQMNVVPGQIQKILNAKKDSK